MTAVPPPSMLWESVDPAHALTERFGFADTTAALGWLGGAFWDNWSVAIDGCDRIAMSAGNLLAWVTADGQRLIAKWSVTPSLFARLADTAALTVWLRTWGAPVAAPIPARDGRLRVELDGVSLGLCPVVDGDLLDADDPAHVAEAGHLLATLHEALAAYPHRVGGGRPTRNEQLVHNDYRSANILHDGTSVTAVLDLEEAIYATRTADLAKATVLLGTRYRDWRPTGEPVRRAFVAAYAERAPLTRGERHDLQRHITTVCDNLGWAGEGRTPGA